MIRLLRTLSTRRLVATLAVAAAAIGGGTAIAVAATSGGPVPKRESLAKAIHQALSAPRLTGLSADITFTNHLISSSDLQGSDPILNGASGRLWYAPARHELRIELQSDNGDAQVLVHGRSFWVSDPSSNTVYEGNLPRSAGRGSGAEKQAIPSIAAIQSELNKLASHVDISRAVPSDTGGAPTYTVRVSPRHDGGLLGAAQLAFDAARGVPLEFAVYASGDSTPVLELQATGVSFGAISPAVFAISPPSGDKVVKLASPARGSGHARPGGHPLSGLSAVAKALPFKLTAPSELVGLPRQSVARLDFGAQPGALVTYGHGLGAIVVIEHASGGASGSGAGGGSSAGSGRGGLSLPSVSIDGVTGHELDTALGTVISFGRAGVDYTVLGSVPPAAAEAAARAL